MFKKILSAISVFLPIHKVVNKLNEIDNINNCVKQVLNNGGIFYKEARVNNLSKTRANITVGRNTHIRGELEVFAYGGQITIGENGYVGEHTKIRSGDKISIGNNVLISHNVNIVDGTAHEIDYLERAKSFVDLIDLGHPKIKGSIQTAPIVIEDFVWINFNVVILKGVTIGKGSIIAAGSVVTKDVPPFVLIGGNPAKVLKSLN